MMPIPGADNRRRSPRRALNATTVLRTRNEEFLCKACDLSPAGLGLVSRDVRVVANDPVEADVLLGTVMRRFRGIVVFSRAFGGNAQRAGIRFADTPSDDPASRAASDLAAEDRPWGHQDAEPADFGLTTATAPRNRRATPRRRIRLQAEVEPGRRHEMIEDISETGAFLWSPTPRAPGQKLRLTLRLAHGIRRVTATIRWTLRATGEDPFGTRSGMGVAFDEPLPQLETFLGALGRTL